MNILELGVIGELVGGIAVVASLLFVGLQIRGNTRTSAAATPGSVTPKLSGGAGGPDGAGAVVDLDVAPDLSSFSLDTAS